MSFRTFIRIVNGVFWLWMWLSAALMPITGGSYTLADQISKLFSINPNIDNIPRLIGNAVIPLGLWFIFDRIMKPNSPKKLKDPSD